MGQRQVRFDVSCPRIGFEEGGCHDLEARVETELFAVELFELDPGPFPCGSDDFATRITGDIDVRFQCSGAETCRADPAWRTFGKDNIEAQWAIEVLVTRLIGDDICNLEDPDCCTPPPDEHLPVEVRQSPPSR